jgi:hypothetical protein
MRSNDAPATVTLLVRPMPVGPRNAIDRLHSRERLESIVRLRAAARALVDVDVAGWDDSALTEHLEEISATLCALDAQVSRVADAVRARGYRIAEPLAA